MRCPFCNNTVIVPDVLRRTRSLPPLPGQKTSVVPLLIIGVVVSVVLVAGVVVTIAISFLRPARVANVSPTLPRQTLDIPRPSTPKTTPSPAGFATEVLKFGSEGTGAGTFTDARHIAVDGEGRIYVGEYSGGRVQGFDAAGKFITQWIADAKMPMRGLAADRKGTVYVVQRGKIERREGATGALLGVVQYADGNDFDDVTMTAEGGLIAAWQRHRDDIVRFDASGRVVKVIKAAISGQTDRSELQTRVAVDGAGNTYALGTFNNAVFKFSPDGRFINKFGGDGNGPGQFRAPLSIAVDHRGRVYVSDIKGIQVFDGDGRYLTTFKPSPIAFGMVFNDNKELFVAARTQVFKLTLNEP
ncbi:MAG TPA: 6-bladed beta-propeller [Pyrinomonadaceae bacterium]|nr:6-bladed beta-propeller [Pyrinomonadaceae bacterium]